MLDNVTERLNGEEKHTRTVRSRKKIIKIRKRRGKGSPTLGWKSETVCFERG